MYNNFGPPGQYGAPATGPSQFAPPGMGAPPTMSGAPGMNGPPGFGGPPGFQQAQRHNAGGFPPNFQPPPNMPDIDMTAPVIRLGMGSSNRQDGPGGRPERFQRDGNAEPLGQRRGGLGYDRSDSRRDGRRDFGRDMLSNFPPPTKEEVSRTIWVSNISDRFGGDEGLEAILNAGGGLRRWRRVVGVDDKPASFGFAEYEDADSLNTAFEVLQDVKFPKIKPQGHIKTEVKHELILGEEDTEMNNDGSEQINGDVEKTNGSIEQINEEIERANRESKQQSGDVEMQNGEDQLQHADTKDQRSPEIKPEDDIFMDFAESRKPDPVEKDDPADTLIVVVDPNSKDYVEGWRARGSLKNEVDAQFRIDSGKEDLAQILYGLALAHHRAKEAQIDGDTQLGAAEVKLDNGAILNIPLALDDELSEIPQEARESVAKEIAAFRSRAYERDMRRMRQKEEAEKAERQRHLDQRLQPSTNSHSMEGVPLGPKARRGYGGYNPYAVSFDPEKGEEGQSDADDEELYLRKTRVRDDDLDGRYADKLRGIIKHERSKATAHARQTQLEKRVKADRARRYNQNNEHFAQFDDDAEARRGHIFYRDPFYWLHERRRGNRGRELAMDFNDREQEHDEQRRARERQAQSVSASEAAADHFLAQQAEEMEAREQNQEPARVKISFGVNPKKAETRKRRAAVVVENLLEDESDEEDNTVKRTFQPIIETDMSSRGRSEADTEEARRQLAAEIPRDLRVIFGYKVKWAHIDDTIIEDMLHPAIEKKIMTCIGMQDAEMTAVVETSIRNRGKPDDIVKELSEVLDYDEAEELVKHVWRMIIFSSEANERGILA